MVAKTGGSGPVPIRVGGHQSPKLSIHPPAALCRNGTGSLPKTGVYAQSQTPRLSQVCRFRFIDCQENLQN